MRARFRLAPDPRPDYLVNDRPDVYCWKEEVVENVLPRYYVAAKESFWNEPLGDLC